MTDRLSLLSGTVVKTQSGHYYVKNNVRVRIPNKSVLKSWRFARVVKTTDTLVSRYPIMGTLGYRDGTLLWCIADAKYYIISGGKRHLVIDPGTLRDHGLRFKDAFIVSKKELGLHEEVKP